LRRQALALALVLSVGFFLRARGLDWGLPWSLHIDERLFVVGKSIQLERTLDESGPPDPGISSYGILPLWLLVLARKLFLTLATTDHPPIYGDPFAATVLLARWISTFWGTATILFVWLWGRRFSSNVALVAAALVAGFPALVQTSHFGTVEAPLVALLAGGMAMAERLARQPSFLSAVAGGVMLGLAGSVKLPGWVLALPLGHALWQGSLRLRFTRLAALFATAVALVFLLDPGSLARASGDAIGEHMTLTGNLARIYSGEFRDWTLAYARDVPVWTELTRILPYAIGVLPEIAAFVGLAIVVRRRSPEDTRLLLLLVPLLLVVFPARVKTIRFLLPALPALAILAAEAVRSLLGKTRLGTSTSAILAVSALLHGFAFSAIYAKLDSRVAAARWLDENVERLEIVAVEDPPGYGPPLGAPAEALRRPLLRYEILWRGFYAVHEKLDEDGRARHIDEVLAKADYLALSEGHRVGFTTSDLRSVEKRFYADLDAGRLPFRKVASFKSYPALGRIELRDDHAEILMWAFDHPRIDIWKRDSSSIP
jgi:hypothetical protein